MPIKVTDKEGHHVVHDVDEGIRYPVNVEKLTSLPPLKKGMITIVLLLGYYY